MTLPIHNHILWIAQIVTMITYLLLLFSGRYALGLCVLGLFGLISIAQITSLRRESRRLDRKIRQVINEIEMHYRYEGLSISKPINIENELQGLREDIDRHLAKDET